MAGRFLSQSLLTVTVIRYLINADLNSPELPGENFGLGSPWFDSAGFRFPMLGSADHGSDGLGDGMRWQRLDWTRLGQATGSAWLAQFELARSDFLGPAGLGSARLGPAVLEWNGGELVLTLLGSASAAGLG